MSGGTIAAKWVIVLVVAVMFSAAFIVIAADRLETGAVLPIQPDTDSYTLEWCGAGQPDFYTRGHYGNEPQTRGAHNGEIFERSTIWYSWTAQGESFPILASLEEGNCGGLLPHYTQYVFYTFSYTEDKKNWVGFGSEKYPESFVKLPTIDWLGGHVGELGSVVFTINGYTFDACTNVYHDVKSHFMSCGATEKRTIKDGAVLRVEVWGGNGQLVGGYEDRLIGADELQLRSAIPYVHWDQPSYKVGDIGRVSYRVPTTKSEDGDPAYFMQIIDCNTDTPLAGFERIPIEQTSGKLSVPILEKYISIDLATCQNRLRALIWSELIVAAFEDTSLWSDSVIETGLTRPAVTEIKTDKDFYFEGETITVTWTVDGNVTKVHVTIDIGGLIVLDDDMDGTVASTNVRAARAGTAQIQVTPYNRCFAGEVKRAYAVVSGAPPEICMAYPDLPMCNDDVDKTDWIGMIIAILAIVFLLVALFLSIWLFSHYEISLTIGLLVSLVVVLVMALVMMSFGAFDALLRMAAVVRLAAGVVA